MIRYDIEVSHTGCEISFRDFFSVSHLMLFVLFLLQALQANKYTALAWCDAAVAAAITYRIYG